MAAADNRATWEQLLAVNQGPTGPTGPQGPAGPTGATGPQGPQGSGGFAIEDPQIADFAAVVNTYYPVNVNAGNVTATLPDLNSVIGGETVALAIISGGNDLVLAGFGGQTVRRGPDVGPSVNVSVGIGIYSVTLIADTATNAWVAIATA